MRPPPRSTRTDTSFPTRRSSDLEIGEAVGAADMTASMVRFLLPDQIRLYGPETFSGTVLSDVGFELGDHAWNEYSMFLVSSEQLELRSEEHTSELQSLMRSSYAGLCWNNNTDET